MFNVFLIAIGLSMDSFAASIAIGSSTIRKSIANAVKIAALFALFQSVFPLIGWFAGVKLEHYISSIDHWIAFFILLIIGGKVIKTSLTKNKKIFKDLNIYVLMILAMATSVDALIIGVSFALIDTSIISSVLIIGIVTFTICTIGALLGSRGSIFLKNKIEIFGGLILILIGFKILIEHLI